MPRRSDVVDDVLALMEMAWHDCYGEVTPPNDVVDDVLLFPRAPWMDSSPLPTLR